MDEWTFIYPQGKVMVGTPAADAIRAHLGSVGADIETKFVAAAESRRVDLTRWDQQGICVAIGLALKPAMLTRDVALSEALLNLKNSLCPASRT